MAMDPLCEGAKALGHALPSWHWWLSLTATDQATWFAGVGAFAAAIVALGIALSDGWRRKTERQARARLTMASMYSPMVGILAMVHGISKDARRCLEASRGTSVFSVVANVESMKNGCDVIRPLIGAFSLSEAIYLEGDYGTALAAAVRDVELMVGLVTSVTDKYLPAKTEIANIDPMYKLLQSLSSVPSMADAIGKRMTPFVEACGRNLGELKEGEKFRLP